MLVSVPEGDECKPNRCGSNSGCRMINSKPVCFCLPGFDGTPPRRPCSLPKNPCEPSPCGPNTQCSVLGNGFSKCTCLGGYIESPNTIRGCVEPRNPCEPNPCGIGAVCDAFKNPVCSCPEPLVGNPYRSCTEPEVKQELCRPGPCGQNADCYVTANREQCYCRSGFIGDPYSGCRETPRTLCVPNPCAAGAICEISSAGQSICRCPDGMGGDPTSLTGCHGFECRTDDECGYAEACIGFRCRDPCPGACGIGADCKVEKHHPVCACNSGLLGNPLTLCSRQDEPIDHGSPCNPSPCGENTNCIVANERAVCSCLQDYLGDPQTGCHPECVINSDCPSGKACVNKKCLDPCSGSLCGINAECNVRDHTPSCSCFRGYTGDAFIQCLPIPAITNTTSSPCIPSPCGPDSTCIVYGNNIAICDHCLGPNSHTNPICRPECLSNSDCGFSHACINQKCRDPCIASCGPNAWCTVVDHNPICSCPQGLYGNPFEHCSIPMAADHKPDTCDTIRCGSNTECREQNGILACVCKRDYYGNPLIGCRPECIINPDCPNDKACAHSKCVNPCIGACGVEAMCQVVNHVPVCYCPEGHTGNALVSCSYYLPPHRDHPINPCDPSPCGPNSRCLISDTGYAICSCLPEYRGSPPICQPECVANSECAQNQACVNLKCIDPCPGTCGIGARCEVINHNPICSCGPNQQGDPFVSCNYIPVEGDERQPSGNPCSPSPCGPNSICQIRQNRPVCSCVPNYIGSPPYCRPECVLSNECPQEKACIREKCQDPCVNTCGSNAQCHVIAHSAYCNCIAGYQGDAFVGCSKIPKAPVERRDPCNPSPCSENSQCIDRNGVAKCSCIPPYLGDPYSTGCRPECVFNADCSSSLSCIKQHCRDPCPGVCGTNAECSIINHIPVCTCARGYQGDPFIGCRVEPVQRE